MSSAASFKRIASNILRSGDKRAQISSDDDGQHVRSDVGTRAWEKGTPVDLIR